MYNSGSIATSWEKRSQIYKNSIEGVLPKSFPHDVNLYLDEWMFEETVIPLKDRDKELKVLDWGSGYGRLSRKVLTRYKKAWVWGVDVSKTYVSLFNKSLSPRGKAVVSSGPSFPFKSSFFDHALVVTTLMYVLKEKDLKKVFIEISRVLKPGGSVVLIERDPVGYGFVTLGGVVSLLRGRKNREIEARSFTRKDMLSLSKGTGLRLDFVHRIPALTFFLPLMIIFKRFIPWVRRTDRYLTNLPLPSLYVSYLFRK